MTFRIVDREVLLYIYSPKAGIFLYASQTEGRAVIAICKAETKDDAFIGAPTWHTERGNILRSSRYPIRDRQYLGCYAASIVYRDDSTFSYKRYAKNDAGKHERVVECSD